MRWLGFLVLGLVACSAPGDDDYAVAGFDIGEDPGNLDPTDGACSGYPGGELSGQDLLVLINKQEGQQLAAGWAPHDLTGLATEFMMPGRQGTLRGPVADALEAMVRAAAIADLQLGARSAYRSFSTQCQTFDYKVQQRGLEYAQRFSAEPGRSQHQLGTTVDISGPALNWALTQSMGETVEGQWLAENAPTFGFALSYPQGQEGVTGYGYEPWHFRYIGVDAAAEMRDAGLILETYLQRCQAGDSALACPREVFPEPVANEGFIGGTCAEDRDCESIGQGAFCATEGYPGGHCSLPCEQYCPDRDGFNAPTFCVAQQDVAEGLCHSQCDTSMFPDSGCRAGYVCQSGSRPNGSKSADVCVPAAG